MKSIMIAVMALGLFGLAFWRVDKPTPNSYRLENQWGGSNAAWKAGGDWVIGGRDTQRVIKVEAESSDDGKTLFGTMQYEKEGPIGFRATNIGGNEWTVENQWGGDHAPWHQGGTWVLGGRINHPLVSLQIESDDNGAKFTGSMTYSGEGPIGFRAQQGMTQKKTEVEQDSSLCKKPQYKKETNPKSESVKKSDPNDYKVENQWGGSNAVWNQGGSWKIGSRDNQKVINVDISSSDDGKTLFGTMQYENEGSIGFKATHQKDNEWSVQNQWGGESAPWHQAGNWVLGGRDSQPIIKLQASSNDNGMTLIGTMTYNSEGPIGFRATHA